MIVFDLKCAVGHVFEAWFGSSAGYEAQRADRQIACPICGDIEVTKAVMAPNIAAKGNQRLPEVSSARAAGAAVEQSGGGETAGVPDPAAIKVALAMIAKAQARALESSQWVGRAFAERARAMHLGDVPETMIHGEATPEQARALIEEGVPVAPLIVPAVPPKALN